jgi:hypothetical protein
MRDRAAATPRKPRPLNRKADVSHRAFIMAVSDDFFIVQCSHSGHRLLMLATTKRGLQRSREEHFEDAPITSGCARGAVNIMWLNLAMILLVVFIRQLLTSYSKIGMSTLLSHMLIMHRPICQFIEYRPLI